LHLTPAINSLAVLCDISESISEWYDAFASAINRAVRSVLGLL